MSNSKRDAVFIRRALFAPKEQKPTPDIMLVWADGDKTRARVSSLAPEVTCGKTRFRQDPADTTTYHEI